MPDPIRPCVLLAGLVLAGCATPNTPPATAGTSAAPVATPVKSAVTPLNEARLREAQILKEERRYLEAAAIYEEQSALQPGNAGLVALQARMYSEQARAETDAAKRKTLFKRARDLAEQAEKLGTDDPITPFILGGVAPDGSTTETPKRSYSAHAEADQMIRAGEKAFEQHDYGKARECYQKAAEFEPTNYLAALWTGDANFADGKLEAACEWFRRAVAIEPDNETSHRYLADALSKLGRKEEAMNEYIAAVICEPYQRVTRQHFTPELRAVAEARKHVIPRFPVGRFSVTAGKKEIGISSEADDIEAIYALACAMWRIDKFTEHFPAGTAVRRCLPEELAGLELLVATGQAAPDVNDNDDVAARTTEHQKWQPVLDGLAALKREGLLEAYALLERVDADLAKDYAAYRAEHRDKLERYIRVYWCGFD